MPRAKSVPSTPGRQKYESLWAEQYGAPRESEVLDWDPNTADFFQACAEVLATGGQVFMRLGTGGRSMGIAIWEGDDRHPATWFHETEELDLWTKTILERAEVIRAKHTRANGA